MRKVILSVAPVAGDAQTYQPEEAAEDLIACYRLGATQMHIHARDLQNKLTADTSYIHRTMERVREKTDMLIEVSTGGVSHLTMEERCQPCWEPLVELTSLNVGTVNLGKLPYINQIDDVRYCVQKTCENHKHPEGEMFEIGHLYTLKELDKTFRLPRPLMISLVLGFQGAMPANEFALRHMVTACEEVFPEQDYYWGLIEAGRRDWTLMEKALDMGVTILRVGFEDSPYLSPTNRASSNAELVQKLIEVMKSHDVEPMKPAEARELLHIPQLS